MELKHTFSLFSEQRQPLLKINQRVVAAVVVVGATDRGKNDGREYIWMSPKLRGGGRQALGCPLKTCSFINTGRRERAALAALSRSFVV